MADEPFVCGAGVKSFPLSVCNGVVYLLYWIDFTRGDPAILSATACGDDSVSNTTLNHWSSPYFLATSMFFGFTGMAGTNAFGVIPSKISLIFAPKSSSFASLTSSLSSFTSKVPATISPSALPTIFYDSACCSVIRTSSDSFAQLVAIMDSAAKIKNKFFIIIHLFGFKGYTCCLDAFGADFHNNLTCCGSALHQNGKLTAEKMHLRLLE